MKRRPPSAAFVPPGVLDGIFVRVEGPIPLAILKRVQTGYPKKSSRILLKGPIFLGCGQGTYIAMSRTDVFPVHTMK